jgi:arylsulfatase A-like enzyme
VPQAAGYKTHAIGKWHLGKCDDRYMATYRGFDSYMGYLDGTNRARSHCRFRKRGAEYVRESGMKRMGCAAR